MRAGAIRHPEPRRGPPVRPRFPLHAAVLHQPAEPEGAARPAALPARCRWASGRRRGCPGTRSRSGRWRCPARARRAAAALRRRRLRVMAPPRLRRPPPLPGARRAGPAPRAAAAPPGAAPPRPPESHEAAHHQRVGRRDVHPMDGHAAAARRRSRLARASRRGLQGAHAPLHHRGAGAGQHQRREGQGEAQRADQQRIQDLRRAARARRSGSRWPAGAGCSTNPR